MFEYLMPLLMLRSHPETLLENTCRAAVRAQILYGRHQRVPWGISESAYDVVDPHGNYQYKAFGVPGLGLKRGLAEDLVIAPYATALAALVDPAAAAENFRRLAREGAAGRFGFHEALDFTPRKSEAPEGEPAAPAPRVQVVRASFAHHQGMSLVALANAVLGAPMVRRFHSDPRVQATEPLLQERVPRYVPVIQPRPAESTRVEALVPMVSPRRFRSPFTLFPSAHFLSNGQYTAVVTNAGGGASTWRGRAVTRQRDDPTCDPGSQFVYLRDVRSGLLWSAAFQPVCREPERYRVTFRADDALFVRTDDGIETRLEITVSPEDDVEVRRVSLVNHSDLLREIEVTSLVEVVLAPTRRVSPTRRSSSCSRTSTAPNARPCCAPPSRSPDELAPWAVRAERRGGVHGAVSGRPTASASWAVGAFGHRRPRRPGALGDHGGGPGPGLEPAPPRADRARRPGAPGVATGVATSRAAAIALAEVRRPGFGRPHLRARHRGPDAAAPSGSPDEASSTSVSPRTCCGPTLRCALRPRVAASTLGQSGLWAPGVSGDLPILVVRVVRTMISPWCARCCARRVLASERPYRRRRDPQRPSGELPGRDARAAQGLLEKGPWAAWRHRPGVFLLRGDGMPDAERGVLLAAALRGAERGRGELAASSACPAGRAGRQHSGDPHPSGRFRCLPSPMWKLPRSPTRTDSAVSAPAGAST